MKFNPLIIFNLPLIVFLLIGSGIIFFLYKIQHPYILTYLILGLVFLGILFLLYSLNKGISVSSKTMNQIEARKNRISYLDDAFIIDYPLFQMKEKIKWNSIEAIFLSNSLPQEGKYHTLEYTIFFFGIGV